jgi:Dolichyl-phosphate-mannose-protein mannosyltransferase
VCEPVSFSENEGKAPISTLQSLTLAADYRIIMKKTKNQSTAPAAPIVPPAAPLFEQVPAWVWLVLTMVVILLLRIQFLGLPLERDESTYAYLGQRLLEGQRPYVDFYEMKPPVIFAMYALINLVFGYSEWGLHTAAIVFTLLNAGLIWAIGRMLMPAVYSAVASVAYGILSANLYVSATYMESELIVMVFALGSTWASLRWYQNDQKNGRLLLISGILWALATLVKQTGLFFAMIPVGLILHRFYAQKPRVWRHVLTDLAWWTAGTIIPIAVCAIWMTATGSWAGFWFWCITYTSMYSSAVTWALAQTSLWYNLNTMLIGFKPYWVLAGAGLVLLLTLKSAPHKRLLLLLLTISGLLAIFPGKRFYAHYWLQFYPAFALLMGYAVYRISTFIPQRSGAVACLVATCLILVSPAWDWGKIWTQPDLPRLSGLIYPGNPLAENQHIAQFLKQRIQPGDQVASLGSEPQIYVYLNQKAPSKHFYGAILSRPMEGATAMQEEALSALVAQKPKYVVFPIVKYSWVLKEKSSRMYYEGSYKWVRSDAYKPILLAELTREKKTKYFYNEEAATRKPATEEYIVVYERIQ